ncbi:ribonuclease HIII [bacterium]|nr:ribonuclease HIII [bacterium]
MLNIKDPTLAHVFRQLLEQHAAEERLLEAEPVQYGIKLTLSYGGLTAGGTLYHSPKKRRLSWVPNGSGDPAMAGLLTRSVAGFVTQKANGTGGHQGAGKEENDLQRWIGTDEAGKGDLFGPLVVGGFFCTRDVKSELAKMGVRDSKELSTSAIKRLAGELQKKYPAYCAVVEISPTRYNEMYGDFERLGGINGLLGWGHARAIKNLVESGVEAQAAVVDRFAGEHRVTRSLPRKGMPKLILRPKAESNLAVAAGAILARARFDAALDKMKDDLGFRPHAGSGSPAVKDLKTLHREKGDDLYKYVKSNFSPVKALGLL